MSTGFFPRTEYQGGNEETISGILEDFERFTASRELLPNLTTHMFLGADFFPVASLIGLLTVNDRLNALFLLNAPFD